MDLDSIQFYLIIKYAFWWLTGIFLKEFINAMECLVFNIVLA